MSLDGGKICHSHHTLRKQEAAARSSHGNSSFEECLRRLFRIEVCQQDEKSQCHSFDEDEVYTIEAKVAAMHSCEGGDLSGRVDAQILGVIGDMRR